MNKHEYDSREQMRQSCGPLLLPPADAARLLSISPRKLWEMTNCRTIPHVRVGRSLRYALADLEAWIEAHKVRERSS